MQPKCLNNMLSGGRNNRTAGLHTPRLKTPYTMTGEPRYQNVKIVPRERPSSPLPLFDVVMPMPSKSMILHCCMEFLTHQQTIIFPQLSLHSTSPMTPKCPYSPKSASMISALATKMPQHHAVGWPKYLRSMASYTMLQDS